MSDSDRIDEMLRTAGQRWRASAGDTDLTVDAGALEAASRRPTGARITAVAGVATLLAVAAVLALSLPDRSPAPGASPTSPAGAIATPLLTSRHSPSPSATINEPMRTPQPRESFGPRDQIVSEGDLVTAAGVVMGSDASELRLCIPGPTLFAVGHLMPTPSGTPSCGPAGVRLVNVTSESLPAWTPQGDGGFSDWVRVIGEWRNEAVWVTTVEPAERPSGYANFPLVPCEPPAGGWPGDIPQTLEGEDTARMLQEEVDADPRLFSGLWSARIDEDGAPDAAVVGTTGNVAEAYDRLRALFPYNLCVVHMEYSVADLAAVESRAGPVTIDWRPNVNEPLNRVVIELPWVTDEAIDRVEQDLDAVLFRPLVEKVGD